MKLSRFLTRLKIAIPNLKETGATDDDLAAILNEAVDEVNLLAKVYKGYTDFNIIADQSIYQLSVIAPRYLGIDKKRVYLKNSNGDWKYVDPKTKDWLEKIYPDYLNASSVSLPQWYWVEGDELGFHQPPSTAYLSGGRIYHLLKRVDMVNADSYPFSGGLVEITALKPLDDAILAYARWKLAPAIGAVTDADLRWKEFLLEVKRGCKQINRRLDIANASTFQMNIQ